MTGSNRDSQWDSVQSFDRFVQGNESAADEIFHRYIKRLMLLARSRLSKKLASRMDPEDVVMSAYRSFFLSARDGKFTIEKEGDLWRLLVEISLHKLYRGANYHLAAKRSVDAEVANVEHEKTGANRGGKSREPSPDLAMMAADELEKLMRGLQPVERRVVQSRLQGYSMTEIAKELEISDRTVRRYIAKAKSLLLKDMPLSQPSKGRPGKKKKAAVGGSGSSASLSDYRLLKQIAVGATGKVYRATHKPTGRIVAIKYLRKELIRDRTVVERFDREARFLKAMTHANVIPVHEFGATPGGGRFIAMEFVPNGDLREQIAQGPVSIDDAVRWISQAADGVHFAHSRDILHCDLKPANLLLDANRMVVVTDFGLARAVSDAFKIEFAGTPQFMAPEQIDAFRGPNDERTDVYGLGASLYNLLTGQPVFQCESTTELLSTIVSAKRPLPVRQLRPEVGESLAKLVHQALSKQPEARQANAGILADSLRAIISR